MPDIIPVDHDPFEGVDPFELAAARTRAGVLPPSGRQQQGFASNVVPAMARGLAELPERAMHAAGDLQRTGDVYDPAPAVETALMTMGVPGMAAPVSGTALGSGIVRAGRSQEAMDLLAARKHYGPDDAALRRSWEKHGPDVDWSDYAWDKAVKDWNANAPSHRMVDPESYKFGTHPDFESQMKQKFPDKREPYPGRSKALEWLVENDPANHLTAEAGITQPIRAYHGSPHDFERFDMSKIGTGEGAQAYGHGLYVAENEGVAKAYRDGVLNTPVIDTANKRMTEIAREMEPLKKPGSYREFKDPRGYELAAEYDRLMAEKMKPGKMYEVNVNAHPEHFLDWDKPLSEQGEVGQKVVGLLEKHGLEGSLDRTGQSALSGLHQKFSTRRVGQEPVRDAPERVTAILHEAGIPGIRYADQGSRFAKADQVPHLQNQIGQLEERLKSASPAESDSIAQALNQRRNELSEAQKGTSNYVVFDDKLIDIVRKYGLAGLSMLPPAMAAGLSQQLVPVDHQPEF